jgi:YVTN family beta-propeller protein
MNVHRVLHALAGLLLSLCMAPAFALEPGEEKIYVAVEGKGSVAVFDAATRQKLRTIDLAVEHGGVRSAPTAHNVQVAPDGGSVWVTVNNGHSEAKQDKGHAEEASHGAPEVPSDEVLVIDPATDAVTHRIPVGPGLHLAHVVLTPDSATAYVSAQNEGAIYRIDAKNFQLEGKTQLPATSQPHGFRIAPDGSKAYIALLQGRGLGVLDLKTGAAETIPLNGAAVQTAVTPDGKFAIVSLYDTKRLAVFDTATKAMRYIELLDTAKGPVQLYPTPDSRYVYVADQGHYFNRPDSQWIYKVDLTQARVVWSIQGGTAPHGIVISKDGQTAYVTNLVSDDLSVIDLKSDKEVARLPVGDEPNGASIWNKHSGGTP